MDVWAFNGLIKIRKRKKNAKDAVRDLKSQLKPASMQVFKSPICFHSVVRLYNFANNAQEKSAQKSSYPYKDLKLGGGGGTLVAMTTDTAKKKGTPQILKTDTALKLAEKWVANMTRLAEADPVDAGQEVRPPRLGLGAKVSRQTKRRHSDDPLDQKLQTTFDAGKRKYARSVAESAGSSKNAGDESEDDDESESKSQAFGKKKKNTSRPH